MGTSVPQWVVGLAIVITAGLTAWIMWRWGLTPDLTAPPPQWDSWPAVQPPPWSIDPRTGSSASSVRNVAAAPDGIPIVQAGARSFHVDRGICVNCHTVVTPQGTAIPPIHATSPLIHEFRGVCGNCHRITLPEPGTTANDVTGGPVAAAPAAAPPAPPPPTEGEWQGLEVAPIDLTTASQYRIPLGTQGVVVTEVEGLAASAGLLAGDVISAVEGVPILGIADFVRATRSGLLPGGDVEALRNGRPLWARLTPAIPAPAAGTWPGPRVNAAAAGF